MGLTLKAARTNVGLNQKDAAREIGISVGTLSNYENGIRFPDVPTIIRIEKVYGIPYSQIIFLPSNNALSVKDKTKHKEERHE